jgi:DnaJ-domain-containing protein 1
MGWFRSRRRRRPSADSAGSTEGVHLDDASNVWWSQGEVTKAWRPKRRRASDDAAAGEEPRDILAEHFGDDWRTSFGFTPPTDEELAAEAAREQQALDDQDPYKVLQVEPTATWEEIVAAHRHQARAHHPDRLFGQSEEEQREGEDRIRVINAAYQELRVRRGM